MYPLALKDSDLCYNSLLRMATFHILNFGCRASQADGAALKQQLLQAGLQEASSFEESAVAILNTCTVTAAADAEVRQFVRRIHRRNPQCRILVTGCYAQRAPEEIAPLEGVAWVVGNSHKHLVSSILSGSSDREIGRSGEQGTGSLGQRVVEPSGERDVHDSSPSPLEPMTPKSLVQIQLPGKIESWQETGQAGAVRSPDHPITRSPDPNGPMARSSDEPILAQPPTPGPHALTPDSGLRTPDPIVLVGAIPEEFHFSPVFADDRTRPTLKIQDGCAARCSFCIIPTVRGESRSLPPDKVVEQVRGLKAGGYQEVVLSGINLGGYGRDLGRSLNFLGVLERILRETSIPRLRISSIEPMDVSPELIRLVAQEPRLAQHFHVPLQSGCDRILRLMNRRYWTRQYAERMLAIHERLPNAALGADVMVGFPGETAQDHATSIRFIESLPYTYLHIFPFSARPGTPAFTAAGQVNGRVARERSQEIRGVINAKRLAFLAAQVGQSLPALTLDDKEEDHRLALTTNYLQVALPGSDLPANRLINVNIGRAAGGKLYGYVEAEHQPRAGNRGIA